MSIVPVTATYKCDGKDESRTQVLLMLAWARSIHKAQGRTETKLFVDIDKNDYASGLVFVGLSRCETRDGMVIKQRNKERFIALIARSKVLKNRLAEDKRLWRCFQQTKAKNEYRHLWQKAVCYKPSM